MRKIFAALAGLLLFAPAAQAMEEVGYGPSHMTVVRCNADGSYDCANVDCSGTNWCCV